MNSFDKEYYQQYLALINEIDDLYQKLSSDIAVYISGSRVSDKDRFLFKDHISISKKVDKSLNDTYKRILISFTSGISGVWSISNKKNDQLIEKTFKSLKSLPKQLTDHNNLALKSFTAGKIDGYTLSERVWNIKGSAKKEIERAIDAALTQGKSAKSLAKDITKYLNNPDALYRRIKDKHGNLKLSANALNYHPGQGVYRSAHKNAMRLARDVINKAYRESDFLRWQQNPSVIGYRIQNSNREYTVCDVCKYYNGLVFPKSHKFIGFHVQCACTAIPILVSDEQFNQIQRAILKGEKIPEFRQPDMPKEYSKKD